MIKLSNTNWHLNINDKARTIQGVHISDSKAFNIIKSTITMECTEGWKPTSSDIRGLIHEYYHPSPDIVKDVKEARKKFGF